MEEPPPTASFIGCCDRLEGASGSSLRMPSHADGDLDVNVSTLEGLQRKILTLRQGILRLFPGSSTVNADGSQVSGRRNLDRKVLYSQQARSRLTLGVQLLLPANRPTYNSHMNPLGRHTFLIHTILV